MHLRIIYIYSVLSLCTPLTVKHVKLLSFLNILLLPYHQYYINMIFPMYVYIIYIYSMTKKSCPYTRSKNGPEFQDIQQAVQQVVYIFPRNASSAPTRDKSQSVACVQINQSYRLLCLLHGTQMVSDGTVCPRSVDNFIQ